MSAFLRATLVGAALVAAAPALAAKKALAPGERIDLARAPVTELMRLPGVGQKKAQALVAYRQRMPLRSTMPSRISPPTISCTMILPSPVRRTAGRESLCSVPSVHQS